MSAPRSIVLDSAENMTVRYITGAGKRIMLPLRQGRPNKATQAGTEQAKYMALGPE
jgi:hypothetical protein